MNVTVRLPRMTREQFLDWAARQEAPYEFDGNEPVAMTGANQWHSQLCRNLVFALWSRLSGSGFQVLPEAGVSTVGQAVRYPDVLVAGPIQQGRDRVTKDPAIVFEVVSPSSERLDRTIKLSEYRAVPSIRRYVIVDGSGPDVDVFSRSGSGEDWVADSLTKDGVLALPEVGIEVPVEEIYRGVTFD